MSYAPGPLYDFAGIAEIKRLRATRDELLDVAKCLRQHLALFCGPDDAIANEIFAISDAAITKAKADP